MNVHSHPSNVAARFKGMPLLRIGVRLSLLPGAMVLLMVFGSIIAFWQFLRIQHHARQLYRADQLAVAVLQLHDDLFNLRDQLQALLNTRQTETFLRGIEPLRQKFQRDIDRPRSILLNHDDGFGRHRIDIGVLSSVQSSLPNQIEAMAHLVQAGDWDAAQRRLDIQVRTISEATGQLVQQIGVEVSDGERADLDQIAAVQQAAVYTLWIAGLLTIVTGTLLGWLVTRSITRPLADLDAGAQALSRGDFGIRVAGSRHDELGRLAHAFNTMAERLQSLYGALQHSEAQFRSLIEHGSDLILLLDGQAVVRYVSPSLRTRLGLDPEQLVGAEIFSHIHADDLDLLREAIRIASSTTDTRPALEIRIRHASGRWHTVEIALNSLVQDSGRRDVILNGRDVTVRKALEEQLLQSQKMQAVGRLAAGVAHDFNNLLTVILGHCEIQLIEDRGRQAAQAAFKEILEAAKRASSLTRQLLTFSRQQVTRTQMLDLNDCIVEIESMLNRLIGEDILFEFRPAHDLGRIRADSGMIQQVVMNLVVNARDAMPHGGSVIVETKNVEISANDRTGARQLLPGQYVVLSVADSGVGMTPETQKQIFEPFFTTKEVGKGTGLGLSTVYGIVQQCDGLISVASAPGKGSAFHLYFPRFGFPEDFAPSLTARSQGRGGETVLLLQEEESLRIMIEEYLTELGYRVLVRPSCAAEAMDTLPSEFVPDLVIADLDGAHGDPSAIATQCRRQFPALKILYIVTDAPQETLLHASGFDHVNTVRKPFGLHTFSRSLRALLDG